MKKFAKKYTEENYYKYPEDFSCKELYDAINALPGIKISCTGSGKDRTMNIFFDVYNSKKGLFFLTRCVDSRYWRFGGIWRLELQVGDIKKGSHLPITYMLTSNKSKGQDALDQAFDLVDNMNYHLNHKNFMKGYGLKYKDFDGVKDIRQIKLEKINEKS